MKSVCLTTNFPHPMNRGGKIRTDNILKERYRDDEVILAVVVFDTI